MLQKPIVLEVSDHVYAINEFGLDTMYVVVGEKQACLIDCGMGTFNLKELVESITDKPYIVLLTHGHQDHCGSIDLFDDVWVCEKEMDKIHSVTKEGRMDSCHRMRNLEGEKDIWEYKDEDVREWKHLPNFHFIEDGQIFDLGGRTITSIYTPGHSLGSVSFIDSASRILFSGDACNWNLLVMDCPLETEYKSMLTLKSYENEFDRNFNGHLGFSGGMSHISMPKRVLDDIIAGCEVILSGKEFPHTEAPSPRFNGETTCTYLCGTVSITYRKKYVREGIINE